MILRSATVAFTHGGLHCSSLAMVSRNSRNLPRGKVFKKRVARSATCSKMSRAIFIGTFFLLIYICFTF